VHGRLDSAEVGPTVDVVTADVEGKDADCVGNSLSQRLISWPSEAAKVALMVR